MAENLEMDMKIVNEYLQLEAQEKERKSLRKEQLRKEVAVYHEHILQRKLAQKQREKEIDEMYRQEEERFWNQKSERWAKEQQARDQLMRDVIDTIKQQIHEARNKNNVDLSEVQREREVLERDLAKLQEEKRAARAKQQQQQREYKTVLESQMVDMEGRKRAEKQIEADYARSERELRETYARLAQREMDRVEELPRVKAFRGARKYATNQ